MPNLARRPAAVAPGQVSDKPVNTMDWTATLIDAAGTSPQVGWPLDGASVLPWLRESAGLPEHDLFWRTSNHGALRRGKFKYLFDKRDRPLLGNRPRWPGEYHLLYDVTVDGREQADLAGQQADVLGATKSAWGRTEAGLLPYSAEDPGVPSEGQVVSEPD